MTALLSVKITEPHFSL